MSFTSADLGLLLFALGQLCFDSYTAKHQPNSQPLHRAEGMSEPDN